MGICGYRYVEIEKPLGTAAPRGLCVSGKRDSNPRPSAWKADALSTELFPQGILVGGEGFEPTKPKQQIYSLSHLTTLETSHHE